MKISWLRYEYYIVIIFMIIYTVLSFSNMNVDLVDSFGFFGRANALNFNKVDQWLNGYYPFGYPLLLKALSYFLNDYLISAKVISLISAFIALLAILKIFQYSFSFNIALCGLILVAGNPVFLKYATSDNTDIAAFSLMITSIYFIFKYKENFNYKYLVLSGLILGFAYLNRYTGLVILPAVVLWLILDRSEHINQNKVNIVLYSGAFLLAALPIILLHLFHKAEPFWNTQQHNVWFGIYGDNNWGLNWGKATTFNSLKDVILVDPVIFLKHFARNILGTFLLNYFKIPLYFLFYIGIVTAIITQFRNWKFILLSLTGLAFISAISIAFVNERVLLYFLPVQIYFWLQGLVFLLDLRNTKLEKPAGLISYLFPILISIYVLFFIIIPSFKNPVSKENILNKRVNEVLEKDGIIDRNQVLSLAFHFYQLRSPIKEIYPTFWYGKYYLNFTNMLELKMYMINHGYHYLVGDNSAVDNVSGLDKFWWTEIDSPSVKFDRHITDTSGLIVWSVESDFFNHNTLSSYEDCQAFLNSNPIQLTDSSYYQRIRDPYFHLIHQKDGPWEGLEWYKDNLFPAWVRYKTDRNLF